MARLGTNGHGNCKVDMMKPKSLVLLIALGLMVISGACTNGGTDTALANLEDRVAEVEAQVDELTLLEPTAAVNDDSSSTPSPPTPEPSVTPRTNKAPSVTQTPPPVASTPVPSLPADPGAVQGTFFTKADENDGAIVSQNVVAVSFAQDGSGAFQGMLDITYVDGTHILLNMSGPLNWSPTSPQVDATLQGTFTLDAPIDSNDVTTTDASISISSLEAGAGALCTTKCFGFTFPPVDIVAVRASATPSPLASATPAPVTLGDFGEVTVDTSDALLTAGNREASANEVFTAAIFDPAGVRWK